MTYYTIYKITNRVNNKIYIGKHQTKDLDDGYLGSGKILKRAIEKYDIGNFDKKYLFIFEEKKDMDSMEAEIVNEEFVTRLDTYNLKIGGEGGFDYINENKLNNSKNNGKLGGNATAKRVSESSKLRKECQKRGSERYKINYSLGNLIIPNFNGKKHTDESKKKIGKANSVHQRGSKNSSYGTCWIHNTELKENKRIKKEEFPDWVANGWIKGSKVEYYKSAK